MAVTTITINDYVTIISLAISIVSVSVVIFVASRLGKRVEPQYHKPEATSSDYQVEVSAIVTEFNQRLKRLEENLVDQKVKLEIMELRAARFGRSPTIAAQEAETEKSARVSKYEDISNSITNFERPSMEKVAQASGTRTAIQKQIPDPDKRLGVTELEALRLVFAGRGRISAKEIQQRIGRTREHTARMMNSLYHDGLVGRDVTARPFSYSITEKGRDLLNG
jgi:hypothetical protein